MADAIKIVEEEEGRELRPGIERIQETDSLLTSTFTSQASPLIAKKTQDPHNAD